MKILNVDQIRALDQSTIQHEPIAPINLMERAALAFVDWFVDRFPDTTPTKIFCGLGNNGGDGLAIARLLLERNYPIEAEPLIHHALHFLKKKSSKTSSIIGIFAMPSKANMPNVASSFGCLTLTASMLR